MTFSPLASAREVQGFGTPGAEEMPEPLGWDPSGFRYSLNCSRYLFGWHDSPSPFRAWVTCLVDRPWHPQSLVLMNLIIENTLPIFWPYHFFTVSKWWTRILKDHQPARQALQARQVPCNLACQACLKLGLHVVWSCPERDMHPSSDKRWSPCLPYRSPTDHDKRTG